MKTLTLEHVEIIEETNSYLAFIFDQIGIAEFSKSSKKKEIFYDVANRGKINPEKLNQFASVIEELYHQFNQLT